MKVLKQRPSGAMVVAFLALTVAIGGTASGLPGKKSIDKNDLKQNVVKAKHVQNNVLGSADVADQGLTGADVLNDGLTGTQISEPTLRGVLQETRRVRVTSDPDFDSTDVTVLVATCLANERLVGGGFRVPVVGAAGARPYVSQSAPVIAGAASDTAADGDIPNAWLVRGVNDSASDNQTLISFAVCASVAP